MKTLKTILATLLLIVTCHSLPAQTPPPPNGGHNPTTSGNNPVGTSAPIGGGLFVLLGAGIAYGAKKIWDRTTEQPEE